MTLFSQCHSISHADGIFHGNSGYAPGMSKWLRDGQPVTALFRYDWDAVAMRAGKSTGLMVQQTLLTNGTQTMAGTLVTSGVGTMDVPRAVRVDTRTLLTASTFLIFGTDYYGEALSEEIGIPTSTANQTVNGKKAFKTVTCIAIKNTVAGGAASVGFSDILGLPFTVAGCWDVVAAWADTTACTINATAIVAADTTSPATVRTGDVRGTFLPTTLPNTSRKFRIWFTAIGKDTRNNLYGVPQA